jgi:hypothetical protein
VHSRPRGALQKLPRAWRSIPPARVRLYPASPYCTRRRVMPAPPIQNTKYCKLKFGNCLRRAPCAPTSRAWPAQYAAAEGTARDARVRETGGHPHSPGERGKGKERPVSHGLRTFTRQATIKTGTSTRPERAALCSAPEPC